MGSIIGVGDVDLLRDDADLGLRSLYLLLCPRGRPLFVGTLANGYIKSAPLPCVTARAAHITAVTAR